MLVPAVALPQKLEPLARTEDRAKPKAVAVDGMSLHREFNSVYVRAPDHDETHFVSAEGAHLFYQRSLGVWMVSAGQAFQSPLLVSYLRLLCTGLG